MFFARNKEPVMIQEYLSDVRNGDKRIILVNGEVVGAINRIPRKGESRSNYFIFQLNNKVKMTSKFEKVANLIIEAVWVKDVKRFVDEDIKEDIITYEESESRLIKIGLFITFIFSEQLIQYDFLCASTKVSLAVI